MDSPWAGDLGWGLAFPKMGTDREGSVKASRLGGLGSRKDEQGTQQKKQPLLARLKSLTDHCNPWGLKNFNKDKGVTVIVSSQNSSDTHKSY